MKLALLGLLVTFAGMGSASATLPQHGLLFAAPTINGTANVVDPALGEIVYDSNAGGFFGYDQASNWVALGTNSSVTPTVTKFTTTGTSNNTTTYTVPAGVKYIVVTLVGGGGGGAGSGDASVAGGGSGGAGGDSYFKSGSTTILQGSGGAGGSNSGTTSAGGGSTINSPAVDLVSVSGASGGGAQNQLNSADLTVSSGYGGNSIFGGGAAGHAFLQA